MRTAAQQNEGTNFFAARTRTPSCETMAFVHRNEHTLGEGIEHQVQHAHATNGAEADRAY